ncbi:MAG: ABC transporter permease [Oscillospiraceae bacterium]|nr:ABC transporter permease [Oscillospiraceae bacterium]
MKISDLIKLSTDNLKRRKGRTILTVLGVIIGTCSIVMMMSIGVALDKSNEEMLSYMGDMKQVNVYTWSNTGEENIINDSVIEQFKAIEHVKVVSPVYYSQYLNSITVSGGSSGKYQWDGWIGDNFRGISRDALAEYGYEIIEGRTIDEKDAEFTVIAGEYAAYQFYNPKRQWPHNSVEPIPDENGELPEPFVDIFKDKLVLKASSYEEGSKAIEKKLKVVGRVKEDYNKGWETSGGFIIPIEDLFELEDEYIKANKIRIPAKERERKYDSAIIICDEIDNVKDVLASLDNMGYNYNSPIDMLESLEQQNRTIQLILGGLGSIAMLVAAISIANTMTMAIYERRREIGIMKVLGCEVGHIRAMFLAESAGIGLLGGMVGVVISYGLSFVINYFATQMNYGEKLQISIIPLWLVLLALGFSTLVGIVSGYIPANKAVKISALTAIKNE